MEVDDSAVRLSRCEREEAEAAADGKDDEEAADDCDPPPPPPPRPSPSADVAAAAAVAAVAAADPTLSFRFPSGFLDFTLPDVSLANNASCRFSFAASTIGDITPIPAPGRANPTAAAPEKDAAIIGLITTFALPPPPPPPPPPPAACFCCSFCFLELSLTATSGGGPVSA